MARPQCLVLTVFCLLLLQYGYTRAEKAQPTRVRKSWTVYTKEEKQLYLSAVKKAMTSGNHYLFTQLYMDPGSIKQVLGTCGAPASYRKFLLGYENMLRSLDTAFHDLTLPYWDIFEDSAKRISTLIACNGIVGCSPLLQDFGGCEGEEVGFRAYVVNGEVIPSGNCANASLAAYACADTSNCEKCLPRGDWDIGDSSLEFGPTTFVDLIRHARDVSSSSRNHASVMMDTLRKEIQNSVQLTLHSILGGVYETQAAAFDPIFFSHYATLDMVYQFFQSCNQSIALTGSCKGNGNFKISPTATIPMTLKYTPVEKHADISAFFTTLGTTFKSMDTFAVEYEMSPFLQRMLTSYSLQCDAEKSAPGAISYATERKSIANATAIGTFVNDLAACDHTSKMIGSTSEAPSVLISCQLLASLQNGVFTNFSTPVRQFFGVPEDEMPLCVKTLAAVTSREVTLLPSATCHTTINQDTSINMKTDFKSSIDGFAIVTRGAEDGTVRYMDPVK